MPQPHHLRIFLSSPGDVAEERALALSIIERIPHDPLLRGRVALDAVAWDKRGAAAPMLATMTPQQAINDGLPRPSECDIVVVIFWARMGTPLPEEYKKPDGSRFRSGTEWEYEDAMQAARSSGKPEVIIYRRTEEIAFKPSDPDFMAKYEQWRTVQDFFAGFTNVDGSIRQGYNAYAHSDEFAEQFEYHLKRLVVRALEKHGDIDLTAPSATPNAALDYEDSDDARLFSQLRHAAAQWDKHQRSDDFLWKGRQLQAALDLITRLQPDLSDVEQAFLTPEQDRLLAEIQRPETPHYRRALIGERLNELGDTRPGVGLRDDGTPDIVWCEVPGGRVRIIASKTGPAVRDLEFEVAPFKIARYPITYGQFQAFVQADDGYANPHWWQGIGSHKDLPSQPRPFHNHPAEYVSWYDAMAFCRWLSERLGYQVRLPLEWEWQQAASGGNPKLHYPWGQGWNEEYANTRFSDLLRTTAVGMYPQSVAPIGAMDMIGNIWEWCLNELEVPTNIETRGAKKRSLRGCSCLSRSHKAHITYRAGNTPNRRAEAHGFRVCAPD